MKEIYYVYNNEAISSCIFLSILNQIEKFDIARFCLILPFLLDDRVVSYLIKNDCIELELEQLVKEESRLFVSFDKRYLSLLPVTINSLMMLNKGNQIKIENEIVNNNYNVNFDEQNLGNRFSKISEVIPKLLLIIGKHSTEQLYKILKVQL